MALNEILWPVASIAAFCAVGALGYAAFAYGHNTVARVAFRRKYGIAAPRQLPGDQNPMPGLIVAGMAVLVVIVFLAPPVVV